MTSWLEAQLNSIKHNGDRTGRKQKVKARFAFKSFMEQGNTIERFVFTAFSFSTKAHRRPNKVSNMNFFTTFRSYSRLILTAGEDSKQGYVPMTPYFLE